MFVAVKNDDRFFIGYSIRDNSINMDESDLLLEDNIPVWKIRGKKGVLIMCGERDFAAVLLEYNKKLFNFEICDKEMFGGFVSKLRDFLQCYDLVDNKGNWNNILLIIKDNVAYKIENDFTLTKIVDYCSSGRWNRLTTGSLAGSECEPAEKRIAGAFVLVGKMRGYELFPISLYDSKSGKRQIIRRN